MGFNRHTINRIKIGHAKERWVVLHPSLEYLGRRSVPTKDGLCYSINYMKLIKIFYNLYLGKTGRAGIV